MYHDSVKSDITFKLLGNYRDRAICEMSAGVKNVSWTGYSGWAGPIWEYELRNDDIDAKGSLRGRSRSHGDSPIVSFDQRTGMLAVFMYRTVDTIHR